VRNGIRLGRIALANKPPSPLHFLDNCARKRWMVLAFSIALSLFYVSAQSKPVTQATAQRWAAAGFRPAEYHGIVMGKSKKRDVVARFGKPEWEGRGEAGTLCLSYRDIGGWKGIANFDLNPRTLVVVGLDIAPKDLTMQQAKQVLGEGAVETHWSPAACFELGGGIGGPLYLDPEGSTSFIEYRHMGVSIEGGNRVHGISYSSKPIGLDRDPCGKTKVQKRGSRPTPRE